MRRVLLAGRNSPAANARALKADAPSRVRLEEIENAGHAVLLERPAQVLDLISGFLREHRMEATRLSRLTQTRAPRSMPLRC